MMTQLHPYDADLSYHFVNLALAAEIQPLWENDDPNHEELESLAAIPREYYDKIFFASDNTADKLYDDVQALLETEYEQLGAIRVGVDIIPDYDDIDENWAIKNIESLEHIYQVMVNYSRRFTEAISNTVRYSFTRLLMGYALRSKIDGHGIDQSIHSAAVLYGLSLPDLTSLLSGAPWVGLGHLIGWPSRRATINKRLRIVGAPKSHARSSLNSTL